jgi:phosphoribosylformylglycinamidine synthase
MTVYRCFAEKKTPYAVEAEGVKKNLETVLRHPVESVRVLNRYDVENIREEDYQRALHTVFSEPQLDDLYEETAPEAEEGEWILPVEYLPGQFDQRADSCAQCIQLSSTGERPLVKTARLYYIKGVRDEAEKDKVRNALINPVEAREAKLVKPDTIQDNYQKPPLPEVLDGFNELDEAGLDQFRKDHGLAMDLADICFLQNYFKNEEHRDPTITEVMVIDTYWSDHCRHTTFNTHLENIQMEPDYVKKAYDVYLDMRKEVYAGRTPKPITLMDLGTIGAKYLKKTGKLKDLDESEEINACSVKIRVDIDGKDEDWLLMFKNETHNHPTEIEPFGGAATCLGGAIRDPLSGRSYVYQAMRITGAADPLTPLEDTLPGKLPQAKIVTTAANGYSSYGNQIGLATGLVHEVYHPNYVAKRMEVGAVIAAAPAENVIRTEPQPGDVVILLGGRTGRDGCGGATGASKAHNTESLETCGAEVQKGNAPEERKLQRLFRNPEATKLIKRCNDFGAGGVSVAIGELADGLVIDLNKVPVKYKGLNGTELAISESQERMAVVTSKEDAAKFQALADSENLESTIVAEVTEEPRMVLTLDGVPIVNITRDFLNTDGAPKHNDVIVPAETEPEAKKDERSMRERFMSLAADLNVCSQKGLSERFDSTIGAGTVTMPFGGRRQLTPAQSMAAKISVLKGETNTASIMSWGFNPYECERSPFKGAEKSVIVSVAKMIAAGGSRKHAWMSFQEYFGRTNKDPYKWGRPFGAVLGALMAQKELEVAAIGGKDSSSGTFNDIDVPPTLIAFTVSTAKADKVVSDEWKKAGHQISLLRPVYDQEGLPDWNSVRKTMDRMEELIRDGKVLSCWVVDESIAEGLIQCSLGNAIGFRKNPAFDKEELFEAMPGAFLFETEEPVKDAVLVGETIPDYQLVIDEETIDMNDVQKAYEDKLQPVFPYLENRAEKHYEAVTYEGDVTRHASYHVEKPRVLIPVFPGTNCEWDTARAFERQGAEAEIFVIRNRSSKEISESVDAFAEEVKKAQIIAIPGGFSGGDEPEGSAKFITAFFRNPKIKAAVTDLLDHREGLMLGICNGFQALIKLGLVPFGKIMDTDVHCPTLTFNSIGRHQSMLVDTRIASVKSPWLQYMKPGEIDTVAISHGEGRFVIEPDLYEKLKANGQIAAQYCDLEGRPTNVIRYNPNNSYQAVEAITSADGRILGKMGHSERSGSSLYTNIPEKHTQELLFKGAVDYFR